MKISLNTGQGDPERDRARARAVGALAQLGHGVPGPGTAGTPAAAAQVASQAVMTIVAEALGSREEQPMRELKTLLLFGLMTAFGCGGSSNNNGGTVQFTASGEVFALAGYDFPRAAGSNNPVFVDGWQIVFDELLVTFDNITLAENPDKSSNQALTDQVREDRYLARVAATSRLCGSPPSAIKTRTARSHLMKSATRSASTS